MSYRYQLVVQRTGDSGADFDAVGQLEDAIDERLGDVGEVDGHDIGSGETNVFILTDEPDRAFAAIRNLVIEMPSTRVAYRVLGEHDYRVLFPPGLTNFRVS